MDVVSPPRPVCLRCRRPEALCWCRHVTPVETRTRIVILQHPRERRMAIGTARMAHLCLPNSSLHVGLGFEDDGGVQEALANEAQPPLLLYPGPDAIDLETSPPKDPVTLVVLDGTWSQSRKLVQHNPRVAALPRYAFVPSVPSTYRIRREPHEHYVSTIEALAHVLGILEEDPEKLRALLVPFGRMIDLQIAHMRAHREGRRHKERGPKPPCPLLPTPLRGTASRIVCVSAESTALPGGGLPRPGEPHRLVHWTARRLGTGDALDLTLRPDHALSPRTAAHAELPAAAILEGVTLPALLEAWAAFLRKDDVLCAWGRYAPDLMARAGGSLPLVCVDLKQTLRSRMAPPFGPLESWLRRFDVPTPSDPLRGRAGRCLVQLTALLEQLRRRG